MCSRGRFPVFRSFKTMLVPLQEKIVQRAGSSCTAEAVGQFRFSLLIRKVRLWIRAVEHRIAEFRTRAFEKFCIRVHAVWHIVSTRMQNFSDKPQSIFRDFGVRISVSLRKPANGSNFRISRLNQLGNSLKDWPVNGFPVNWAIFYLKWDEHSRERVKNWETDLHCTVIGALITVRKMSASTSNELVWREE